MWQRALLAVVAVAVALVGHAAVRVSAAGGAVQKLTADSFADTVDGSSSVLVEFYAPWCGHCKNLAPEYDRAASAFGGDTGVVLASVDATENRELATAFEVTGYPTLKWFPKGNTEGEAYNGPRDAEGIVAWLNQRTGLKRRLPDEAPSSVVKVTPENFYGLVGDPDKTVIVSFTAPWCGHCKHLHPVFEQLGGVFAAEDSVVVADCDATEHRELAQTYDVSGYPTIYVFPAGDEGVNYFKYEGRRDLESFVSFLNEEAGTFRNADGTLQESAGRIKALDELLSGSNFEVSEELATQAASMAEDLTGREAEFAARYLRYIGKVQEKGEAYVAKEIARLSGMIDKPTVSVAKKTDMMLRRNVLRAFQPAAEAAEADDEQ